MHRIMKQRPKRIKFLLRNPQYNLSYKYRTHGPKHESRSKVAKLRQRTKDGKFNLEQDKPKGESE